MPSYKATSRKGESLIITTYPQRYIIKDWTIDEFIHFARFKSWGKLKGYLKDKGFIIEQVKVKK